MVSASLYDVNGTCISYKRDIGLEDEGLQRDGKDFPLMLVIVDLK